MSRVAVVLVNWNGWKDTVECLESLFRLDDREVRVVVCDNASSDGSVERVKAWANGLAVAPCDAPATLRPLILPPVAKPIPFAELDRATAEVGGDPDCDPPLIIIRTGGNLGFAGGNNVGLRYLLARGGFDFAWLLNNDTVVDPASLGHLVAEFSSRPQLGICGSTLLCYDDPSRISGARWRVLLSLDRLAVAAWPLAPNEAVSSASQSRSFPDELRGWGLHVGLSGVYRAGWPHGRRLLPFF